MKYQQWPVFQKKEIETKYDNRNKIWQHEETVPADIDTTETWCPTRSKGHNFAEQDQDEFPSVNQIFRKTTS